MSRGFRKRGRCPMLLRRILAKIAIPSSDYSISRFRPIPSASSGFRHAPPNINALDFVDICQVACGMGRRPKFLSRILDTVAIPNADYRIPRIRKTPRDPAMLRRIYMCGLLRVPATCRLPSASVGFRWAPPSTHVWGMVDVCHVACGWGAGARSSCAQF